jgi:hypothetical protein
MPTKDLDDVRCVVNTLAANTEFTLPMRKSLQHHGVDASSLGRAILRRVLDFAPLYESLVSSLSLETLSECATLDRIRVLQNLFTSFRLGYALDRLSAKPHLSYETHSVYLAAYIGVLGVPRFNDIDMEWPYEFGQALAINGASSAATAEKQAKLEKGKTEFLAALPIWRECVTALMDTPLPLSFFAPLVACLPLKPLLVENHIHLIPKGAMPVQDADELFRRDYEPFMTSSPQLESILKGQPAPSLLSVTQYVYFIFNDCILGDTELRLEQFLVCF